MNSLSLDELKKFKDVISGYDDIGELKKAVNFFIEKKEREKSTRLNVRFDMDMFIRLRIFEPSELRILKANCISNLQDLIDCDLDSLVGITPSVKEKLDWARRAYNMDSYEENSKKK